MEHIDPSKTREQRRAETLARRHTPEWAADGTGLVNRRAEERAARDRDLAAARQAEAARRRDEKPVTDVELHRAIEECEASIRDAVADTGLKDEVVAYDVVTGQCMTYRSKLAAEVKRVMLGIVPNDDVPLPW